VLQGESKSGEIISASGLGKVDRGRTGHLLAGRKDIVGTVENRSINRMVNVGYKGYKEREPAIAYPIKQMASKYVSLKKGQRGGIVGRISEDTGSSFPAMCVGSAGNHNREEFFQKIGTHSLVRPDPRLALGNNSGNRNRREGNLGESRTAQGLPAGGGVPIW